MSPVGGFWLLAQVRFTLSFVCIVSISGAQFEIINLEGQACFAV